MLIRCMLIQIINKAKVTHQGQGHIKVKVKYLPCFQFYVVHTVKQAGGLHSTEMCSCFRIYLLSYNSGSAVRTMKSRENSIIRLTTPTFTFNETSTHIRTFLFQ